MSISGYCKTAFCEHYGLAYLQGYCRPCFKKYHEEVEEKPATPVMSNKQALQAIFPELVTDPVVEANRKMLLDRSQLGIQKYGTTLAGNKLTHKQWLQHALEEALDLANYLQAEIIKITAEEAAHQEAK